LGINGTREFPQNLKRLRRTPISLRFGRAFRFRHTATDQHIPRADLDLMTQEAMYQLAALLPNSGAASIAT